MTRKTEGIMRNKKFQGTTLYFAYGSNLDIEAMAYRCPTAEPMCDATLEDWTLVFRGVCDVEPAEGATVFGALWRCQPSDMDRMDGYEGWPRFYHRQWLTVQTAEGPVGCVVYVMNPSDRDRRALPSGGYLSTVARGYRDWDLPFVELEASLGRAAKEALVVQGVTHLAWDGRKRMLAAADHPVVKQRRASQARAKSKRAKRAKRRKAGDRTEPTRAKVQDGQLVITDGMSPATRLEIELERKAERRRELEAARINRAAANHAARGNSSTTFIDAAEYVATHPAKERTA